MVQTARAEGYRDALTHQALLIVPYKLVPLVEPLESRVIHIVYSNVHRLYQEPRKVMPSTSETQPHVLEALE